MVFGTFDIFHPGHESFLRQAGKLGDFLIVVIARDATVLKVKKRRPLNSENKRLKTIIETGLADKVLLGSLSDKYAVIKKYKPDVICLGYDQKFFVDDLREKLNEFGLQKTMVEKMKPFKADIYKSSKLRQKIKSK